MTGFDGFGCGDFGLECGEGFEQVRRALSRDEARAVDYLGQD